MTQRLECISFHSLTHRSVVSSLPQWKQQTIDEEVDIDHISSITHSTSILDVKYYDPDDSSPRIIIGFAHQIVILSTVTFDIVFKLKLGSDYALAADGPIAELPIPMASSYHFCFEEENFVVSSSTMDRSSTVLKLIDSDRPTNITKSDPVSPLEDEVLTDYVKRIIAFQLKGIWAGIVKLLICRGFVSRCNDELIWNRSTKHPRYRKDRKVR
jgi:hypothetical protein